MTQPQPDMLPEKKYLTHGDLADVLRVVMRVGALVLRSGAASFRAEECMSRVATALGVERLDAYVTPTGIIASAYSGREHRTQIVRIPVLAVDMNRIVELDLATRHLPNTLTIEEMTAKINAIEKIGHVYPRWLIIFAVGVACAAFSQILGGGVFEALAAFGGAVVAQTVRIRLVRAHFNPIPITVVCAAIATFVSYALIHLPFLISTGLPITPRLAIIASVLLLVPGVPLVTSILDLTRLDLVSGMARGIYAMMLFISIGLGMLLVLVWTGMQIL